MLAAADFGKQIDEDGAAAVRLGADFLAVRNVLAGGELTALRDRVPAPVYAQSMGPQRAWALGASGIRGEQ
jgi:hypothetical protein